MHSSQYFVLTCLERIRFYVDEVLTDAKWDNDFIVRHVLMPEMVNVWSRISRNFDNPVIGTMPLTIVDTTEWYELPPNVMEVVRIVDYRSDPSERRVRRDWKPKGQFDVWGPGWELQGNMLRFRPSANRPSDSGENWELWYIPSGDFMMHVAGDGQVQLDADLAQTVFRFGDSNDSTFLGDIDMRPNAYVGGVIRARSTGGIVEERVIDTYDVTTDPPTCTVRVPFVNVNVTQGAAVRYEVAPLSSQPLIQAVSASAAINLATAKGVSKKQMEFLILQYKNSIKTICDWYANMQGRTFKSFQKRTIDNEDANVFLLR
jgi:hypothetical protein